MLTADADLNSFTGGAPLLNPDTNERSHTILIQLGERIIRQNARFQVVWQKLADIVPRKSECHLCKIIGAKAEEFRFLGYCIGNHRCTRNLDHGTDEVSQRQAIPSHGLLGYSIDDTLGDMKLLGMPHQRNHHFWNHWHTIARQLTGCFENSLSLHLVNLGIGDA